MNIEKIEQIIKLVKENDVKKFKFKNFEDEIEIVVQINGKLKAKVMIEKDLPKDQLEKVALEAVEVEGNIVKVIAIPNKLVNIVVK